MSRKVGSAAGRAEPLHLHASCVLAGRKAVLIRGGSGTGKSSLAFELLSQAAPHRLVRLVADDATLLRAVNGRLIAEPVPAIFGAIEVRGVGLVAVPAEPRAVVGLVVDLVGMEEAPRLPADEEAEAELLGIRLPRLALAVGAAGAAARVLTAMEVIARQGRLPALAQVPEAGRAIGA